jgi:hypothetical protein
MCTVNIVGAIDRSEPDPAAPSDQQRAWIGMVSATWPGGERSAAILKEATGRGSGNPTWGAYVLILRWIGDVPPPEIAQTVYDVVWDGGPVRRQIRNAVVSQPRTAAQPSYRVARA